MDKKNGNRDALGHEECPYFERGFCRQGFIDPNHTICKFMPHNSAKICVNYTLGFCPNGPNCTQVHVKCVIADMETTLKYLANFPDSENWQDRTAIQQPSHQMSIYHKSMNSIRCHNCGEAGHKSTYCQEEPLPSEQRDRLLAEDPKYNQQNMTVLCFKCSHYGHYANVCP